MPVQTRTSHQKTYLQGATFYALMWGVMAVSAVFMSIDLNHRGVTETQWGIISAIRSLIIFLVAPLVTRRADRQGKRVPWLRWLMFAQGCVLLLFMLPRNFAAFLALSILMAVISAPIMPLGDGIIVRMAHRHGHEFGRLRLWGSLGFALMGTLGGWLWNEVGFSYIYLAGFVGYLLVSLVCGRLEEPYEDKVELPLPQAALPPSESALAAANSAQPGKPGLLALLLGDSVLLLFMVAAFLRSSSELMFFSFSGIYIDALTGSAFYAGLINGGAAILEIPVMIHAQRTIRRFGLVPVILGGFVVQTLGTLLFTVTSNPWVMYAGSAVRNVGFALYFVAAVQFIDIRAGKENATYYQGLLSGISWGLAPLLAAPLAGVIYQHWSAQWVFILATLLSAAAALVILPVFIKERRGKKAAQQASLRPAG